MPEAKNGMANRIPAMITPIIERNGNRSSSRSWLKIPQLALTSCQLLDMRSDMVDLLLLKSRSI
jgi:hypothetical protein